MTSQDRIGNFPGTDSKYIVYFESIVYQKILIDIFSSLYLIVCFEVYNDCDGDKPGSLIGFILYKLDNINDNLLSIKRQRI